MMRIKFVEILKFIVAVAIGFTIRVMFENSNNSIATKKPCDIARDSSEFNFGDIHDQLRQPHQPRSIRDVIEYRYFNSTVVFDTHLGSVKTLMKQYHRSDIRDIIRQVESLMNAGANNRYKMKNVINGFERIDPVRGKEYIIDLELIPENPIVTQMNPRIVRYSLVKPFSYAQMVSQIEVSPTRSRMIDMIYILREDDVQLIKFILMHHEIHIIDLFPVNVTMYVCSKSYVPNIQLDIDSFSLKYKSVSSYKLNLVINTSCTFEAPQIANIAVGLLGDRNARMVILDVNVNVTHQFLQRCSSVLSENVNNVYSPIPFAKFLHQATLQSDTLGEELGVWDHDNFEVLCMHKDIFLEGVGLKSDEFYSQAYMLILNTLIRLKKQVFRSTDPSVNVFYHNLKCKDQEFFKYSNISFCEERQRRTFRSQRSNLDSIKLD